MPKTWLVTGCAHGLGRHIAEEVLAAGDNLVATAQDIRPLAALTVRYGEQIRIAALDSREKEAGLAAIGLAFLEFGRLDVVVNNAGCDALAATEQVPAAEFGAVVEACFLGVVNMTSVALPLMRQQRHGVILQIAADDGRVATAGNAAYQAARWAVSGFTETMSKEAAPFGVKICSLEPAGVARRRRDDHEPTVGALASQLSGLWGQLSGQWGQENGDHAKAARLILRLAEAEALPAHLPLGGDALPCAARAGARRRGKAKPWKAENRPADSERGFALHHS